MGKNKEIAETELKNVLNKGISDNKLKPKSKIIKGYIIIGFGYLVLALLGVGLYISRKNILILILIFGLIFPVAIITHIILIYRIYKDKHRIKKAIIKGLSNNYIKAIFLLPHKRKISRFFNINSDGISFNDGKKKYIVDSSAIWKDENGNPCSYYLPNIPSPVKFEIEETLKIMTKKFNEAVNNDNDLMVDVSFSSENLDEFKKAKLFDDFVKHGKNELTTFMYVLMGLIGLAFVTMIIFFVIGK